MWLMSVVFAIGVLWYQGPQSSGLRIALAVTWALLSIVCGVWFVKRRQWRPWAAYLVPFTVLMIWFATILPRNDRDWSPEMAQLLSYERRGDEIVLKNVRNFNWTGPLTADERWETRRYDLAKLKSVDVLSLYWMGETIAHTYFSFVWEGGEALSISIEIRKERGESYSKIGGFFKAYERSILAGDERDFYGWRIFYPNEDIQLFHTVTTPVQAQKLLLEMLDEANKLAAEPAWYNTLTDNCTTETWMLTEATGAGHPLDRRLLLSGYLPDMLHELKLIDTSRPLSELREAGHILPRAKAAIDQGLSGAAFSNALREGVPMLAQ
jgi:hypothetical protein